MVHFQSKRGGNGGGGVCIYMTNYKTGGDGTRGQVGSSKEGEKHCHEISHSPAGEVFTEQFSWVQSLFLSERNEPHGLKYIL